MELLPFLVGAPAPRTVRVDGQRFVTAGSNATLIMVGPNVVVKGPPYLPSVSGTTICNDHVDDAYAARRSGLAFFVPRRPARPVPKLTTLVSGRGRCTKFGNCTSCETFNEADVAHIKAMGWNTIRLGVVWAGAQPRDEDALDPEFVRRLDAILDLTDRTGINVVLDNHGDMVGTAGCGNGVPMWVQQAAAPDLIGAPLKTGLPYSLVPGLGIESLSGYSVCGDNATAWAEHAGDPNYNILNRCCAPMNGPNPQQLGFTEISQRTMTYVVSEGAGRDAFVRYWRLMAEAVAAHPSAFAAELMNEPMTIERKRMFQTWRACAEAINAVVPDMAVSISDIGEGAVLPAWVTKIGGGGIDIDHETLEWIKASTTIFYAWHWYGEYTGTPARSPGPPRPPPHLSLSRYSRQSVVGHDGREQRPRAHEGLERAVLRDRIWLVRRVARGGGGESLAFVLALLVVLHDGAVVRQPLGARRHVRRVHTGVGGRRLVEGLSVKTRSSRGDGGRTGGATTSVEPLQYLSKSQLRGVSRRCPRAFR
jgi:hypothetical protein